MPARVGLPVDPLRTVRRYVRRAKDVLRGETDDTFFPIRDIGRVNDLLRGHGHALLTADPTEADADEAGAMRFVLGLLATRRDLRRRFPRALSGGKAGPFALWLLAQSFLTEAGREQIRRAFAADPGTVVQRVYPLREDLRAAFPLGLTPQQRGLYLDWLVSFGLSDFGFVPEAAVWFLTELDEDPARGLTDTFRVQPTWQAAVPLGLTRFGWDELKTWVATQYAPTGRWLRTATRTEQFGAWDELQILLSARPELAAGIPDDPVAVVGWAKRLPTVDRAWLRRLADDVRSGLPNQPGVNVVGLFRYTSGLQQAVRGVVTSLHRAGVRTSLRDCPQPFHREPPDRTRYDGMEPFDITILNTGIDTDVPFAYRRSGLHPRPGVHRIAVWWWELETVPARFHDQAAGVDEIWAPTRFIADAMRGAFGKPVFAMPPGVSLPAFDPLPKQHFGLDPRRFTVLYVFDMNSRLQRKNPVGLMRAFRAAFDRREPVDLVLKVSSPDPRYYRSEWAELRAAAAEHGAILLDRTFSRGELLGLMNAADCYASLHRSEGFGLTCAEAMLLGKPVVATGYSGNVDFMTADNSYLVDYRRVHLTEDVDPYPKGAIWADPDERHAAELLRRVYDRPAEAKAIGERAKREAEALLSPDAAGRRMAERLAAIRRR